MGITAVKGIIMHHKDLENYLNNYLNVSTIKDYCPNGLQVEGKLDIHKAAVAVSASLDTIEQAVLADVDALIVHHGLFWERDPYPLIDVKKTKIELLLKNGISLFAYHLPLDAHQEIGNNWKAARDLGWENLQPFGEYNGTEIGVSGTFASKTIDKFVAEIENYYGHAATTALGGSQTISSCALISGGAYKELPQAAAKGFDCFITGNFDEPAWNMAHEKKIHFLALGHTATEKIGPKALGNHLSEVFGIPVTFLDTSNPF
jgi:dinuclear metal center YbgI/SA1388 family protein